MKQTKSFLNGESVWHALDGETAETPMRWLPSGARRAERHAWANRALAQMVLVVGDEPIVYGQVTRPDESRGEIVALTKSLLLVADVAEIERDDSDVKTTAIPRDKIAAVQVFTSSPLREHEMLAEKNDATFSPLDAGAELRVWLHVPPHGIFKLTGDGASSDGRRTPLLDVLDSLLADLRS